jgi:hypothetical protein
MAEGISGIVGNSTLIHAGLELVVVGGIVYYMNNRISNQAAEILKLRDMVKNQESMIASMDQIIKYHHQMIGEIKGELSARKAKSTKVKKPAPKKKVSFVGPESMVPTQRSEPKLTKPNFADPVQDDIDADIMDELQKLSAPETELEFRDGQDEIPAKLLADID